MIKLEKIFIGEMCDSCYELSPNTFKTKDKEGNTIISVGCEHSPICHNALLRAASIKLKKER